MRNVTLLLGIWCLICVIINPLVFWEMLFNNLLHTSDNFRYNNAVEITGGTIFFTAFIVSPNISHRSNGLEVNTKVSL